MEKPGETATPTANITTPKNDKPNEDKHSLNWGWIVWPLVVLFFYVLSAGPVFMLGRKGIISPKSSAFLSVFYAPVVFIYDRTFLHRPLGMYLHFWSPEDFDKNGDPHH